MSDAHHMAPGTTVAERYRVVRVLGEGGMGVVYAAEHMLMRKEVALKVLHGDMSTMPEIVARFEREAIAAAAIDHPNVAAATDFGRLPDGACYLVLELLKGVSLRDEIRKGPMPLDRALVIMRGIASGVAAAHAKGIVHRDLKPENVMLVERDGLADFVKVLDFGIAKLDASLADAPKEGHNIVTRIGTIFGTPEYMAPEQAVGDKVDARADIFALGVIFVEMLNGKCPYGGEVLMVLRERLLMSSMPDMSMIPNEAVKALITKMMARHPDERLQTANELLAAIDAIARADEASDAPAFIAPTKSIPDTAPPATGMSIASVEPPKRRRWVVPAGVASIAGLLLLIVAFSGNDPPKLKEAHAKHATSAVAKHAPPPASAPAPPPSASVAEAEPEAAASSAEPEGSAPAPTSSHTAAPPPRRRSRRTGPGGIYIPPVKDWFK